MVCVLSYIVCYNLFNIILYTEVDGVYVFTSGIPDQPTEVVSAYVEEVCAGRDLQVHCLLFNVDDYDSEGAIPSRYANITKTAEILRTLAHSTNGRFHWFRETGMLLCLWLWYHNYIYYWQSWSAWSREYIMLPILWSTGLLTISHRQSVSLSGLSVLLLEERLWWFSDFND